MGYERINVDLDISYEYDPREDELNISALWSNRAMFELVISSLFDVQKSHFKLNQTKQLFDKMSSLRITYRDLGLNRKTIDYCNQRRGDQGYLSAHIEAFKQDLKKQYNLTPTSELVEAYRDFMLESGEIKISSNLQQAINPEHLGLYRQEDVVLLLRPDITVNNRSVDIPFDALQVAHTATDLAEETKPSVSNRVAPVAGNKPEFQKVSISKLAKHIGDRVRVETKQGTIRTGILTATSQSRIKVEISYQGGKVIYPIFINNIVATQVMELPATDAQ
jgi:hypothetical protein